MFKCNLFFDPNKQIQNKNVGAKLYGYLLQVSHIGLSSPADSPAAVQGHRDLLSIHLVELHLDIVNAGSHGTHASPKNALPCGSLSLQSIILFIRIVVFLNQNSDIVFPMT